MAQTDVAEIICKKTGESEMQKSQSSKGTDDAPPPPRSGTGSLYFLSCFDSQTHLSQFELGHVFTSLKVLTFIILIVLLCGCRKNTS